jgi:hypothetical protein
MEFEPLLGGESFIVLRLCIPDLFISFGVESSDYIERGFVRKGGGVVRLRVNQ